MLVSAAPALAEDGAPIGTVLVYQDISTLQLKELARLREEFAAIVAHDMRTPVQSVMLQIAALLRRARHLLGVLTDELMARVAGMTREDALYYASDFIDDAGQRILDSAPEDRTQREEAIQKSLDSDLESLARVALDALIELRRHVEAECQSENGGQTPAFASADSHVSQFVEHKAHPTDRDISTLLGFDIVEAMNILGRLSAAEAGRDPQSGRTSAAQDAYFRAWTHRRTLAPERLHERVIYEKTAAAIKALEALQDELKKSRSKEAEADAAAAAAQCLPMVNALRALYGWDRATLDLGGGKVSSYLTMPGPMAKRGVSSKHLLGELERMLIDGGCSYAEVADLKLDIVPNSAVPDLVA